MRFATALSVVRADFSWRRPLWSNHWIRQGPRLLRLKMVAMASLPSLPLLSSRHDDEAEHPTDPVETLGAQPPLAAQEPGHLRLVNPRRVRDLLSPEAGGAHGVADLVCEAPGFFAL